MRNAVNCWNCFKPMNVPSNGKGSVKCPNCGHILSVKNGKIERLTSLKAKPTFTITKSHIIVLTAFLMIFLMSMVYNYYKNHQYSNDKELFSNSIYLEFDGTQVLLHGITYTVGLTAINAISTNINELNDETWDKLRGKTGVHPLCRMVVDKDKYGNSHEEEYHFGQINLDELNKYQSKEDFKKAGGLWAIVIKENNQN